MPTIHPEYPDWSPPRNEKWRECRYCGARAKYVDIKLTSFGPNDPVADETFTAASGATGKYLDTSVVILSGAIADTDATVWITLDSVTGDVAHEYIWGVDEELVTAASGSTGTMDQVGYVKKYGTTMHPESHMVERDGKWYCKWHYDWKFRGKDRDDANATADYSERDREGEWG